MNHQVVFLLSGTTIGCKMHRKTKNENSLTNLRARILELRGEERFSAFSVISPNKQGFVLLSLPKSVKQELLAKIKDNVLTEIFSYLDPDEVTDLLRNVPERRSRKILRNVGKDVGEKVKFLLKFSPETAAGIMSVDYIEVSRNITFRRLSAIIRKHEKRTGKFPTILVVSEGFLLGEIPPHFLVLGAENEKISGYVKKIPSIRYHKSEDEVISLFRRNRHNKVVVLDKNKSIMGVIYSDDVIRIMDRNTASNLSDFAGVSDEEGIFDSALMKVKHRYKWLIINLGTAFLAAAVVSLFENTIAAFTLLAIYMPIVAGMGGNAGTQTLAVMVRGIALREVELKTSARVIINEVLAGGINGVINGVLVALVAILWNKNPVFGLVIGIAMVINLIIAGFFGAIIPLIMKLLKKDPATSATIFITTATDIFGFFVFLGLASLML